MKVLAFLTFIIVIVSCHSNQQGHSDKISIDLDNNKLYITESKIFNTFTLSPIETSGKELISEVSKLIYEGGHYHILDKRQKAIFKINNEGKIILCINNVGRGPGEYSNIEDFYVNPNNLDVNLIDGYSLHSYDDKGFFKKKMLLANKNIRAINKIEFIDSAHLALKSSQYEDYLSIYSLTARKYLTRQSVVPLSVRKKVPFGVRYNFKRHKNNVTFHHGFTNQIYKIDKDGFKKHYEWDFGRYNFSYKNRDISEDISSAASNRDLMQKKEIYFNKYATPLLSTNENNKYILTNFMFKGKPTSLLYEKKQGQYILFNGYLSKILMFSNCTFTENNTYSFIIDPIELKKLPRFWFNKKQQDEIENLSINSNPVILSLKLNNLS